MQSAVRRVAACVVVPAAIGRAADGGSIPAASTIVPRWNRLSTLLSPIALLRASRVTHYALVNRP